MSYNIFGFIFTSMFCFFRYPHNKKCIFNNFNACS